MKISFLDAATLGELPGLKKLEDLGELSVYQTTTPGQRLERMERADVVITNKVVIDKATMSQLPYLKLICVAATGMNNVDLDFAEEVGIAVKNVKAYSTESVAQHTFALLFHLLHQLEYYNKYVQSGAYAQSKIFTHHGRPYYLLKNKTFGIIGLGTIGKRVAHLAEAFGAKVLYYSTSGCNYSYNYTRVDLDELLSQADVVSIHAPLNERTRNLLTGDKLRLMRPSAFLLNTGRGGIVNEADLAVVLEKRLIAGAALDVLEQEPIATNNPLLQLKDKRPLLMTPHIAWAAIEARELLVEGIMNNIQSFIENSSHY